MKASNDRLSRREVALLTFSLYSLAGTMVWLVKTIH